MYDTEYKLRARNCKDWRNYNTIRLEISVGQEYHEGEKQFLAGKWARDNFTNRYIILGDLPQRFNMALVKGGRPDDYKKICLENGDAWLERNCNAIMGIKVTRWQDWMNHEDFQKTYQQICSLYKYNSNFANAVKQTGLGFINRQNWPSKHLKVCIDYLLEECAVFAVAYNEMGGISAYPGTYIDMLSMFVDEEIEGAPAGLKLAKCVHLCFERRKSSQPKAA